MLNAKQPYQIIFGWDVIRAIKINTDVAGIVQLASWHQNYAKTLSLDQLKKKHMLWRGSQIGTGLSLFTTQQDDLSQSDQSICQAPGVTSIMPLLPNGQTRCSRRI